MAVACSIHHMLLLTGGFMMLTILACAVTFPGAYARCR